MATKAELESANRELVLELQRANSAMENLKKEVVDKARNLAQEHEWCEVVDNALEELGLVTNQRKILLVTVRIPVIVSSEEEIDAEDLACEATWDANVAYWRGSYLPSVDEFNNEDVKFDPNLTTTYEATLVDQ